MAGLKPPGVYAIDDSAYAREWTARWLSLRGEVRFLGHAGTLEEARPQVLELCPDVLLLDLRIPGENVGAFIRDLRVQKRRTAVLIHSGHVEKKHVQIALGAGAVGFIGKEVGPDELVAAILKVHAGDVVFSESVRKVIRT